MVKIHIFPTGGGEVRKNIVFLIDPKKFKTIKMEDFKNEIEEISVRTRFVRNDSRHNGGSPGVRRGNRQYSY